MRKPTMQWMPVIGDNGGPAIGRLTSALDSHARWLLLRGVHFDKDESGGAGDGGGGAGGAGDDKKEDGKGKKQAPDELAAELEKYKADLKRSNKENMERRQKLEAYEAEEARRKKEEEDRKAAEMTELQKAQKALDEAKAESDRAAEQLKQERIDAAIEREARALKFRNPIVTLKLIDASKIAMGEDGKPDSASIKTLLEALAKSDAYLVDTGDGTQPRGGGTPKPGKTGPKPQGGAANEKPAKPYVSF